MFEADFSRTERRAVVDSPATGRADFARRSIEWAKSNDHSTIVWHFVAMQSVEHLGSDPSLRQVAATLRSKGAGRLGGVEVIVATRRKHPPGTFNLPLFTWWPDDAQLLALDTIHRPLLDAFLSHAWRAPIWLTAFEIDVGEPVGIRDRDSGFAGQEVTVSPIGVPEGLQKKIASHSLGMTLSTNGVHDSAAGPLVSESRTWIRSGSATPEAIAVAAIRAGWWPEKIPDLLKKVGG